MPIQLYVALLRPLSARGLTADANQRNLQPVCKLLQANAGSRQLPICYENGALPSLDAADEEACHE